MQPLPEGVVFINSDGKLGTATSSRRFKDDIKPMERASEALFALKPVTFRYKKEIDPQGIPQFGLVAEEVEEVNPDLVVRDKEGKVNTVRYEAVNAMLLNEFLKEHRTVRELKSTAGKQELTIAQQRKDFQATIAQQQKEIQALTASLKRGGIANPKSERAARCTESCAANGPQRSIGSVVFQKALKGSPGDARRA
jgi:predicted ribosome quality control (RQC) complex YloA/Tae2 family protein